MKQIILNQIRCKKCGDILTSTYAHDIKTCSCGSCTIDGGTDYLRRCGERDDWEDLSKVIETDEEP